MSTPLWMILCLDDPVPRRRGDSFELAAARLQQRYTRRFPEIGPFKWDGTAIKDRWYHNGPRRCRVARMRLGGALN